MFQLFVGYRSPRRVQSTGRFASTAPNATAAGYYGPHGFYELKGTPVPPYIAKQAKDLAVAKQLWDVSERLIGSSFR
jgi:hypothetical protein